MSDNEYNELSDRKLGIGYWWLTHKETLHKTITGVLIVFNVLLSGYVFYRVAIDLIVDVPRQEQLFNQLSEGIVNFSLFKNENPFFHVTKNQVYNLRIKNFKILHFR